MNSKQYAQATAIISLAVLAILLGGCGNTPVTTPAEISPILPAPTETIIPATSSPTLTPPTETATPRPSPVPGTKFEVNADALKLELEIHACNMTNVGYGHFTTEGSFDDDVKSMMDFTMKIFKANEPPINPKAGDDVMCWLKGEVLEGMVTNSQLKAWVDEGSVYLLDQAGNKSDLIFGGVIPEKQSILLLFSAPYEYTPFQIQMLDALVDFP